MTTDLAPVGAAGGLQPFPPAGSSAEALARLAEWVQAASDAGKLVGPLVSSFFVPEAYKPKVAPNASPEEKQFAWETARANATAAILLGLSLGVDPMTSLQQIYIVKGRPGMYAKFKIGLLQSRGYTIWTEAVSDDEVTVCGQAPGSEHIERVTITMAMARKAGWTENAAYTKTPQDMLYARAASRVCDRIGSAVLMGIPTVEEIPDEPLQTTATVGVATTATTTRVTAAEILAEPTLVEKMAEQAAEAVAAGDRHAATMVQDAIDVGADPALFASPAEPDEPVETDPAAPIRPEQRDILNELLESARLRRTGAINLIKAVTGRTVGGPADLTAGEAAAVIAKLKADAATRAGASAEPDGEPR